MANPGWGLCTYRGADGADALGALRHADGAVVAVPGPRHRGLIAAMAEFEEMLRRIITAPPKTYEEVKLGKRRRRDGATEGSVQHRDPQIKRARPKTG